MTATTPGSTAGQPEAPRVGPAHPLTAAYCAERAAQAVHYGQIDAADRWTTLASLLANNPGAHRARDRSTPES